MDHTSELSTEKEVKGRPVVTPLTHTPIPARTLTVYTITGDAPGPLSGVCGFTVTITTCTSNYDSWVPCGKHGPELFV